MTQLDNLVAVTLAKLVGTSRVVALPEWILYPLGGRSISWQLLICGMRRLM